MGADLKKRKETGGRRERREEGGAFYGCVSREKPYFVLKKLYFFFKVKCVVTSVLCEDSRRVRRVNENSKSPPKI